MRPPAEFKVMRVRDCGSPDDLIDTPDKAFAYWQASIVGADWYDPSKEAFVVLAMNTRRRIIGHNLVSLGSLDSVAVRPMEVFRPLIVAACSSAILMHNHPSLDPTPSEADIRVTRDLAKAGHLLKIEIVDHVIVGKTFTSLRSLGYLPV